MRTLIPAPDPDRSEVNLTPMLDVIFIMLVFFVVTATFLEETGLPVFLPATGGESPAELQTIAVHVEPGGAYVVNERVVSKSGLQSYLRYLFSHSPDAKYAVIVARDATVVDTVAAIEAGRRIGFDVVPLMPKH